MKKVSNKVKSLAKLTIILMILVFIAASGQPTTNFVPSEWSKEKPDAKIIKPEILHLLSQAAPECSEVATFTHSIYKNQLFVVELWDRMGAFAGILKQDPRFSEVVKKNKVFYATLALPEKTQKLEIALVQSGASRTLCVVLRGSEQKGELQQIVSQFTPYAARKNPFVVFALLVGFILLVTVIYRMRKFHKKMS